jgi:hypothetical protein
MVIVVRTADATVVGKVMEEVDRFLNDSVKKNQMASNRSRMERCERAITGCEYSFVFHPGIYAADEIESFR